MWRRGQSGSITGASVGSFAGTVAGRRGKPGSIIGASVGSFAGTVAGRPKCTGLPFPVLTPRG